MLPPGLHSQYSSQVGANVKLMKLQILKLFLFSSALLICVQTLALDPRVKLNKISSENFDIIYDAKSYELAKIYLEEAERSHQILVDVFGISPKKTTVVLDDTYDVSNGSAIGVPRPNVNVYVSQPTPLASIDHYSSWPRDVFLHEYAHILNMEPARGVAKPLRFIFGSVIRPNMFLPRWYLEGLAVEMESRFNEFGRLKSTDYDAMIRSLYLDSKWGKDNLSAINEVSTPDWPRGQRPYFYGALVWHEFIQSKSISIVRTFNERYARRFPWVITQPMVDEFGKTYQDFLKDVYKKYGDLAQKQISKIQEQETTKGNLILTKEGVFNHSPEISPDGEKLLFVSDNKDGDSVLYVFKRLGEQWVPAEALTPKDTDNHVPLPNLEKSEIQRATWFPSSQKIVFDSVDTFDRTNHYYDLYTYDLVEKKSKKITKGLRAREPAVSPNGNLIAFVKSSQGKTALYTVDGEGKNEALLYSPESYDRVSRPSFISEKELVFAQKNSKGIDRLHILNMETKQITRILDFPSKYPVSTSQGIVFSSNKSGVENLYSVNSDLTSIRALTNTLTKTVNGTIDTKANKIIYSELTSDGPQIKEAPLAKQAIILPSVTHPIAANYPEKIVEAPKLNPEAKTYHALPYMFPQFWIPWITVAEDGTTTSISLPGSDPTGFHSYLLDGSYHSKSEKFSTSFQYLWDNSIGKTILFAYDDYDWHNSLQETTHDQKVGVSHWFYIPGLSNDWKAKLGYEYLKSNLFSYVTTPAKKVDHYFDGPSAGIAYDNMDKKLLDISSSGQSAKATYTKYFENSTKTNYDETFVKLQHFHTKWLPERHVLALSAQTVYTEANRSLLLGTTSSQAEYTLGPDNEGFVTRGYPPGQFMGFTMVSGTVEYRFPLSQKWKGPDSPAPYFIKRFHASIFAETLTLKGIYFNEDDSYSRAELGKYFTAAGAEFKIDTTIFYHAPITFKVVGAYGFDEDAEGGFNIYFTIQAPQVF